MARAAIGLGANLGDRLSALQGAVDSLERVPGVHVIAVSDVYETDPVGGPDQGDFLNAVVVVGLESSPADLLTACQAIESEWHRRRDVRWGPRTLDVDILSIDELVSDDAELTLPHPRAAIRAFVCIPWLDADPDAIAFAPLHPLAAGGGRNARLPTLRGLRPDGSERGSPGFPAAPA